MRRPNTPTKRKQRRNAFGQFAKKKPRPARDVVPSVRGPFVLPVEWEKLPEGGWRAKPLGHVPPRPLPSPRALQADLERGQTLPEPLQALVQQPIQRTLWQRLCGLLRGRA